MPDLISSVRTSSLSVAGPMVHTIFVFFFCAMFLLFIVEMNSGADTMQIPERINYLRAVYGETLANHALVDKFFTCCICLSIFKRDSSNLRESFVSKECLVACHNDVREGAKLCGD